MAGEGEGEDSLLIRLAGWILVVVVVSILLYCWIVFVLLVCVPLYGEYGAAWPTANLLVFHVLLFFVFWSYMRAVFTTSYVPASFSHPTEGLEGDEEAQEPLESETTEKPKRKLRYCEKCSQDKPDRSHHCSRCGRCILKMDHHCPWINNCVGYNNYKYFILFTTYTLLLCIIGTVMVVPVMFFTWDWNTMTWENLLVIGAVLLGAVFSLTLTGFVAMHVRFALGNLTTIESLEKKFSWGSSPYNVGVYNNWVDVFGKNPLLWALPVNTLPHDGCIFSKNEIAYV